MSFFRTVWLWIKRLLFIAAMGMCIGCAISVFDELGSGLGIFLNILSIVLAIGNCFLFFMFGIGGPRGRLLVTIGIIVHLILILVLLLKFNAEIYAIGAVFSFIALIIHNGGDIIALAPIFNKYN